MSRQTMPERFWSKVDIKEPNECWVWLSATVLGSGYGSFWSGGKSVKAHRYIWECINGPIPDKKLILHKCDNRLCVNPNHLYLGTHSNNMSDRAWRNPTNQGGERPVLYEGEIQIIKNLKIDISTGNLKRYKFPANYVAKMFKVDPSTISRIWSGKRMVCKEGHYV